MKQTKVAVVGGGIFGATAAIWLARRGHRVDLFERHPDILQSASGSNQFRLHRGYHYPRSIETIIQSLEGEPRFRAMYPDAVVDEHSAYYAIASKGSQSSASAYLNVLEKAGLGYQKATPPGLRTGSVELALQVEEGLIDPVALRSSIHRMIKESGVRLHLGTTATPASVEPFDFTVLAAYARLNEFMAEARLPLRQYQFEVCEILVVRLPEEFRNSSVVVMDGPFFCFDPLGRTELHLWYDVAHSVHYRNVGHSAEVPETLRGLIDRGLIRGPSVTNFDKLVAAAEPFFPGLKHAEHIGSYFTVRTVLPNLESTDARPSMVEQVSDKLITILSGKICTCIDTAERAAELIDGTPRQRARLSSPVIRDPSS